MEIVFGVHSVTEAVRVRPGDLDHVTLLSGTPNPRVAALLELCRTAKVRVAHGSRDDLSRMTRTENHGGAVAFLRERKALTFEDLLAPTGPAKRFLLALDGVEDPHNLGALLRTADGAGVDGVVMPERRSAPLSGTVAKASAGATEHVRVARVTNLVRALEELKRQNIWIVGLDERGTMDYDQYDFRGDIALVLGREGAGLHDLTRKTCDFLLRVPMAGAVPSLNVSVAGAVVMYEAARQRRRADAPAPAAAEPSAKPSKPRKGLGS
ncbi:MAG: 23S rRNA (guanosine(2251)-2'-O)-methyltransferase RlmB [Janthinobacterium lividum]